MHDSVIYHSSFVRIFSIFYYHYYFIFYYKTKNTSLNLTIFVKNVCVKRISKDFFVWGYELKKTKLMALLLNSFPYNRNRKFNSSMERKNTIKISLLRDNGKSKFQSKKILNLFTWNQYFLEKIFEMYHPNLYLKKKIIFRFWKWKRKKQLFYIIIVILRKQ